MKLKKNYVLRQVAKTWVVLPLGEETVNFSGMLKLNESGALLWQALEGGGTRDALVKVLTDQYAVELSRAQQDVDEFLNKLIQAGCVETH